MIPPESTNILGLNEKAMQMLTRQKVTLEIDAETYELMNQLAKAASSDIASLLTKLGHRYAKSNWLEKQIIINFLINLLKGV